MSTTQPWAIDTARSIVIAAINTCLATSLLLAGTASAADQDPAPKKGIKTVFYIDMENHNWTQPASETSPQQVFGNPAAPYINSLVTPNNPNGKDVSYCTAYHNVLATASGNNPSIHPSEPNYIWQENGSNLGILDDNDPYAATSPSVPAIQAYLAAHSDVSGQNLSGLLEEHGILWKAYQEDTNLLTTDGGNDNLGGSPTNTPVKKKDLTVPLSSFSGTASTYTNTYNGSHQFNFACKHDGTLFFVATNGGDVTTTKNTQAKYYQPLQQLFKDLNTNKVGRYNLITPDQYNDMHSALANGFTYHGVAYTGDQSAVAAGDNFLSIVIPEIMKSKAYQDGGVIVIWWDESEGGDDFSHTVGEIIISPLAKGNAFASTKDYTHSSDVNTLQKIFQITASTPTGFLNDAANPSPDGTFDLSDLFQAGVIPTSIPPID
jgi:phosphatidylinositol-3-phosphatase